MTTTIIITLSVLLLFAYVFDITSSKTKLPSVILLLSLGWAVKLGSTFLGITIPDLTEVLPVLGTIGLLLIVLEGSLELELNRSKLPFIAKSSFLAIAPMLVFSTLLAFAFQYFTDTTFRIGLIDAIPFAIISSAIAIPSAKILNKKDQEFITYESSLSDIFGILLFNFISFNESYGIITFGHFFMQIFLILIIAFISTIGLAYLLKNIKHQVKFVPIILMLILIFVICKHYHLPSLIFIMMFGLFLGNLDKIKIYGFRSRFKPQILSKEVHRFKELVIEITFLIRALFFLLFGYLIQTEELINTQTLIWAIAISAGIYIIRYIFLKLMRCNIQPLLSIAPRGLITILIYLSIPASESLSMVNKSLITQVIVITAFAMMFGLFKHTKSHPNDETSTKTASGTIQQKTN